MVKVHKIWVLLSLVSGMRVQAYEAAHPPRVNTLWEN